MKYTMSGYVRGTIATSNIEAKVLNSSSEEVGTATVTGSGTSYTITVDTSGLSVGNYNVKIPAGVITTSTGISSQELISTTFEVVKGGVSPEVS